MKKKHILYAVIGLVVLGVIGSIFNQEDSQTTSTSDQGRKPPKPASYSHIVTISARDLYAAYEENEIAADMKYKDKVYTISGTITSIGKDIMDSPYIVLETDNIIGGVQCLFGRSEADLLVNLSKNQYVSVKGTIKGKALTNILVRKCNLQ